MMTDASPSAFTGTPSTQNTFLQVTGVPSQYAAEWERCGRTADFVADFFALTRTDPVTARYVISTAVNELLENAVKFSVEKQVPFTLDVTETGAHLIVRTRNCAAADDMARLDRILDRLAQAEPRVPLLEELEAADLQVRGGGLGLLFLAQDKSAVIGAQWTPPSGNRPGFVTVEVRVDVREFDGHARET